MILLPTRSHITDPLCPFTTLFRTDFGGRTIGRDHLSVGGIEVCQGSYSSDSFHWDTIADRHDYGRRDSITRRLYQTALPPRTLHPNRAGLPALIHKLPFHCCRRSGFRVNPHNRSPLQDFCGFTNATPLLSPDQGYGRNPTSFPSLDCTPSRRPPPS